jgi:two-component system LytT family response regulator
VLRVILIDDEPQSIIANKAIIERISVEVEIVGAYTNPFEGLEALRTVEIDLLLLDIEMPGLTGLELLNKLGKIDFEVIFVTAYQEYAIDAFTLSAMDYILKPVSPLKLTKSLESATNRLREKREINNRLKILKSLLEGKDEKKISQEERITFASQKEIHFIQVKDIIRIEGAKNYTDFHCVNERKIVVSRNLGSYNNSFRRFNFMKIHRSHIINLYHVTKIIREGFVEMTNGDKIRFSPSSKEELIERLESL